MNCRWLKTADGVQCERCKRTIVTLYGPARCHATCRVWPLWHEFGEWLAILLAAVGVNPRRWGWVRWKLGFDEPGGCGGCEARKRWLNTLGGRLATSGHWAAKWATRLLVRQVEPSTKAGDQEGEHPPR